MLDWRRIAAGTVGVLALIAIPYELVSGHHVADQVALLERNLQKTQQQVTELKESTVAAWEDNIRRIEELSQKVTGIQRSSVRRADSAPPRRNSIKPTAALRRPRTPATPKNATAKNRVDSFCAGWIGLDLVPLASPAASNLGTADPQSPERQPTDDQERFARQGGVLCVSSNGTLDVPAMIKASEQMKHQLASSVVANRAAGELDKAGDLQPTVFWSGKSDPDEIDKSKSKSDDAGRPAENPDLEKKRAPDWHILLPQRTRPQPETASPSAPSGEVLNDRELH